MSDRIQQGVLRILQTETDPEKLNAALDVIEEFKSLENAMEWLGCSFESWAKLEQLEDALRLLTGRGVESVKDIVMLEAWRELRTV